MENIIKPRNLEFVKEKINKSLEELNFKIINCKTVNDFHILKNYIFQGENSIKVLFKSLESQEKKEFGGYFKEAISNMEVIFEDNLKHFLENDIKNEEDRDFLLDVPVSFGSSHIIPQVIKEIKTIFLSLGFESLGFESLGFEFLDCPEIETEFRNFTALNIPENHPTRTDHQTFFLNNGKILRTQTSNMQTYALEKIIQEKKTVGNFFTIGRTFRRDSDATHTPMFHQLEVFSLSQNSNLKNLFTLIKKFLSIFFNIPDIEIRIRPSFFPFTEPSYEIDFKFNGKWLEILGCGITNLKIFEHMKFSSDLPPLAFALGCGVDRLAMIKYNISDLRTIFSKNAFVVDRNNNSY